MDKETLKHLLISLCTQKAKDQFAAIEAALSTAASSPFTREEVETILAPYRERIDAEKNRGKDYAKRRDYGKKTAPTNKRPFTRPSFRATGFRCTCDGKGCERRSIEKDTPRFFLDKVAWHVLCLPEQFKEGLATTKAYQAWLNGEGDVGAQEKSV